MPEIERGIGTFAYGPPHDGLIVMSQLEQTERERVVALAARYRLPAVYPFRRYVAEGGLIAYGTDQVEPYREAAGYVDRILNGERPVRAEDLRFRDDTSACGLGLDQWPHHTDRPSLGRR